MRGSFASRSGERVVISARGTVLQFPAAKGNLPVVVTATLRVAFGQAMSPRTGALAAL